MYAEFFHLSRRPFSATPDPDCCYLSSPGIARLLSDIVACIEGGQGIAVATGEAGIGKSLLVRYLAQELQDRFEVAVIGSCQFPTARSLLQSILFEMGQPYQGKTDQELRLELIAALKEGLGETEGNILFLDEAHLLSTRLLEEVRVLADLSHRGRPLLQIVLAGQPQLDERLTEPACATFNQRVAVQGSLPLLSRQETMEYIDYRTKHAGQPATELFTLEAMLLIAQASDGLPRCVNQLCDHSLMLAYVEQAPRVDLEIVRMALEDLQQLPLHWNPTAMSLGPLEALSEKKKAELQEAEPLIDETLFDGGIGEEEETADEYGYEFGEELPDREIDEDDAPGAAFEFGAEMEMDREQTNEAPAGDTGTIPTKPSEPTFRIDGNGSRSHASDPTPAMNAKKSSPPQGVSQPAEERIFDRYAILDAGRNPAGVPQNPPQSGPQFSANKQFPANNTEKHTGQESAEIRFPSPPNQLRGPMSSAFFEHSAVTPPYAGEGIYHSDPLEFLDEVVMPLIEHAQQDELPTRSELDRRLNQFIAAQRAAVVRRKIDDKLPEGLTDQEEEIGEEALDLCLDLQLEMGNTIEVDPADLPDFSIETERSPRQELPGAMRTSTDEAASFALPEGMIARGDSGHTAPPAPKYQFVFSELRRRLRAESRRSV